MASKVDQMILRMSSARRKTREVKITEAELKKKKKKNKRSEDSSMTKSSLINNGHIKAVQTEKREEEKKKKRMGNTFEDKTVENFPELGKIADIQVQDREYLYKYITR